MESHPAELLREALALTQEARSALIDSLIESLEATVDEGATDAWKREIELRLKQIDDGNVELISWSDARTRLRDRLEA
jgi:putative addiction module component (TIGR02574 family)